jgi:hypothetical protein
MSPSRSIVLSLLSSLEMSGPTTNLKPIRLVAFAAFFLFSVSAIPAGEAITVAGIAYRNAEWADVCREGLIYKTETGAHVTLSWAEATPAQVSAARATKPGAFENALYDAYSLKGTVFQVNPDGVILQVEIPDEHKEIGYKDGAKILENGLVIVKDLPTSVPQGEGAAIEIVAHKRGTFTFDLGIAMKEIPLLTVAKPLWAIEQEWKNAQGQAMFARLIAVKDSKGMFEKGGKRFIYDLTQLDADGQKRAAEVAEKLKGFPIP